MSNLNGKEVDFLWEAKTKSFLKDQKDRFYWISGLSKRSCLSKNKKSSVMMFCDRFLEAKLISTYCTNKDINNSIFYDCGDQGGFCVWAEKDLK